MLSAALLIAAAFAQDDEVLEVVVEAEAAPTTATETTLDRTDVETFPARSADELLTAMPGMHVSSHGGRGKALQFLVRGFDAEHGADVAVALEGIPLNEVSNVHGQGYLDMHFLPTVLVESVALHKGAARADVGDFAVTGSVDFDLGLAYEGLYVQGSAFSDLGGAGLAAWRPQGRGPGTFAVAEVEGARGIGEGRGYRQARVAFGADELLGGAGRVFALAYDGAFESPGVLREDDLISGSLGFYDAYPQLRGGVSRRALSGAVLEHEAGDWQGRAVAWGGARQLRLDENFTGYFADAVDSDGVRQEQGTLQGGGRAEGTRLLYALGDTWSANVGVEGRVDTIDQAERDLRPDGSVGEARIDADATVADAGAWAQTEVGAGDWLSVRPGLRAEHVSIRTVRSVDSSTQAAADPASSTGGVLAPKLAAALRPVSAVSLFGSWGRGFRTPEARGIEDGDVAPIMRADHGEVGLRVRPWATAEVQLAAFRVDVDNELVFDHAVGRFLSAGATRRQGLEAVVGTDVTRWLSWRSEVTLTDGTFTGTGEPIPYAPRWLVASTATVQGATVGGWDVQGGLRGWFLGTRPLPDGYTSRPSTTADLTASAARDDWTVSVDADNIVGARYRDGEFVYASWFDTADQRSEIPELHVTAGNPTAVRVAVGRRF